MYLSKNTIYYDIIQLLLDKKVKGYLFLIVEIRYPV